MATDVLIKLEADEFVLLTEYVTVPGTPGSPGRPAYTYQVTSVQQGIEPVPTVRGYASYPDHFIYGH